MKTEVTKGDKGGKPGQWSARKAQLAVNEYKHEGGGYKGEKAPDNHLVEWQHEDWGTKSGAESGKTGERYLPKEAREALTDGDYQRTTAKKRADSAKGKQFSAQPQGRRREDRALPVRRSHQGRPDAAGRAQGHQGPQPHDQGRVGARPAWLN